MKKPKFTHGFVDRHGKPRFYFRREGFASAALPGLPWSLDFMAAYEAAMAGETAPRREIGTKRAGPGTIAALTVAYFNSAGFQSLAQSTRTTYRGIIENFAAAHGDKRVALMQRRHVEEILAGKVATPAAANNWLRMVKMLMAFAVEQELRGDDPTTGIKSITTHSDGFYTWSEADISQFEAHHAIGTMPRLALALLLYTAQRRSDVVKIGRQHIRDGVLTLRQKKTHTPLEIPVHPVLAEIIAATPSDHLMLLTTSFGKPFTEKGFGGWFRKQCNAAGVPAECSAHGLRKAACRRLAEAGCSANVIASISGHASLREVERYTKAADQARMARQAMTAITPGTSSGKL